MHLPIQPKYWLALFCFGLIAIFLYYIDPLVKDTLNFHSDAIYKGEVWRMLTGHLLHSNLNHLLLNLGGLFLLWALHGEYYETKYTWIIIILCGFLTSLSLMLLSDTHRYVGLSGVIHSLFAWGAIQDLRYGYRSGWLLIIGLFIKIVAEQIFGASDQIASMIATEVAIDSHLFGAFSGLFVAIFYRSPYSPKTAKKS